TPPGSWRRSRSGGCWCSTATSGWSASCPWATSRSTATRRWPAARWKACRSRRRPPVDGGPAARRKNMGRLNRRSRREAPGTAALRQRLRKVTRPLARPRDLAPLLERVGDARSVLLGEASHGTGEYYTWRAVISQRLIREKGFSFIAVEGDWPDCYRVNRYVKGQPDAGDSAREVLHAFERWPTWMWANEEIVALAEWLRRHNDGV